jgi:hypothetical protein
MLLQLDFEMHHQVLSAVLCDQQNQQWFFQIRYLVYQGTTGQGYDNIARRYNTVS